MQEERTYRTLSDIQRRKRSLKNELSVNERTIQRLWRGLFYKQKDTLPLTPTQRIVSLFSSGRSILDGAILGWKIYRRFRG